MRLYAGEFWVQNFVYRACALGLGAAEAGRVRAARERSVSW